MPEIVLERPLGSSRISGASAFVMGFERGIHHLGVGDMEVKWELFSAFGYESRRKGWFFEDRLKWLCAEIEVLDTKLEHYLFL